MGLFSNPRDNKKKWAKIVMPSAQNPELLNDGALYIATAEYIAGHARILYESVQLVMTSENKKTRDQRYALAADHRRALKKVRKFADKTQKKEADKALKAFDDMENCLNQIERDKAIPTPFDSIQPLPYILLPFHVPKPNQNTNPPVLINM